MTVVNETKQHVHVQNKIIMYFMDSTIISSLLLAAQEFTRKKKVDQELS
jgi:hypothetical protein